MLLVVDIAKVRDAAVRRKVGCGIRRTASGRRVMKVRMEVVGFRIVQRSKWACVVIVVCMYIRYMSVRSII